MWIHGWLLSEEGGTPRLMVGAVEWRWVVCCTRQKEDMLDHTVTAEMAIQGVALEEVEVMEDQVGWTAVMVELVTTIHEVDMDLAWIWG